MADPRRIARQRLESLQRAGVSSLKKGRAVKPAKASEAASTESPRPAPTKNASAPTAVENLSTAAKPAAAGAGTIDVTTPLGNGAPALKTKAEREVALDVIRHKVSACPRCPELCSTRKQTVFGVGSPTTKLCFLGEAPGADEDAQGEPFVGRAGQLLTKIIEACTLKREDVYILNVLKCRPPNNRPPTPEESANCREYLDAQLDIIRPRFICCLGATAAKQLLGIDIPISKLRGKFQNYRGVRVMCTYHPAYLLRNPAAKREVWDDMKTLMREMGIDLEKK
ncbi:MAG: uracil-DNA glycosylase [Planctomycetes bacterium]|nr:uracil-DNA glycosylase [Planctomycetota bacterium]